MGFVLYSAATFLLKNLYFLEARIYYRRFLPFSIII